MSSLIYLVSKSVKNTVLEILHKPAKLILWVVTIGGIVGLFFLSVFTRQQTGQEGGFADLIWLKGGFFAFITIFVVLSVQKGLSSGDTIFDMSDVNLLFVSPVSPRSILLYGIVRMARTSFLMGFFILFQSNSLGTAFGLDFGGLMLLFVGFLLAMCLLQILSLLIYSLTNGNPARKRVVQGITVAVFLPVAVTIAMNLTKTGEILSALEATLRTPVADWTPVMGWASAGASALIGGNLSGGLLFFGLIVAVAALLIVYIALSNPDYYEDVLVATETAFERKNAAASGRLHSPDGASKRRVRVDRTGIGGAGASALFYKHLRESFRANRLGLWGLQSVLIVAGAALFCVFMRGTGAGLLALLQALLWTQLFLIGTGRGLRELYSHYIYLIPESSFAKIVWSNLEIAFRVLVESVVLFTVCGIILKEQPVNILLAILLYTLYSLMLIGINYLSLRWTGSDISAGLLIFIYTIAVVVIMVPGLVAAIIVGTLIGGAAGFPVGMAILAAWELLAALGCFALSRGALHNSDMPTVRVVK